MLCWRENHLQPLLFRCKLLVWGSVFFLNLICFLCILGAQFSTCALASFVLKVPKTDMPTHPPNIFPINEGSGKRPNSTVAVSKHRASNMSKVLMYWQKIKTCTRFSRDKRWNTSMFESNMGIGGVKFLKVVLAVNQFVCEDFPS